MSKVIYYKDGNDFKNEILSKDGYTLVDFFATWCGPCQQLGPELDALSEEVDYKVVKVDIDVARNLAIEYGVRSVPTMFLFKDSEVKGSILGFRPKDDLKREIENLK